MHTSASSSLLLLLLLSLLAVFVSPAIQSEKYTLERNYGIKSDLITAQPQIGNFPSQYFLCGVSLRESLWQKLLWNCNCGRRWYSGRIRYRCNYCNNQFWSQVNAVKATFCSYSDWNMQIEKVFETGATKSRNWRDVKCPKGQYASRISGRFGHQNDVDIGFVGLQIKCQNINLSENSLVQDTYGHPLSELSKNKQGNFVSGFNVKYVKNGNIVGMTWNFEAMPVISKIDIAYSKLDKIQPTSTIIEKAEVVNNGSKIAQKTVAFTKAYDILNKWTNSLTYTSGYKISQGVSVSPMPFVEQSAEFSSYSSKTENFTFNQQLKTTFSTNQQMLVLVPSGKRVTISSIILEQKVNVPYEATLYFENRFTKEPIGVRKSSGILEGVLTSSVKTVINESPIDNSDANTISTDVPKI